MVQAEDVMTSPVLTISCNETVRKAAIIMAKNKIGCLIVDCADGRCNDTPGIITERDLLKRITAKGRVPDETLVSEIMSTNLRTITADTDMIEIGKLFAEYDIRRLPVEKDGKIIGIISISDLLKNIRYISAKRICQKEYSRPEYERKSLKHLKHSRR